MHFRVLGFLNNFVQINVVVKVRREPNIGTRQEEIRAATLGYSLAKGQNVLKKNMPNHCYAVYATAVRQSRFTSAATTKARMPKTMQVMQIKRWRITQTEISNKHEYNTKLLSRERP